MIYASAGNYLDRIRHKCSGIDLQHEGLFNGTLSREPDMVAMTVELRNVPGTEAALGWAGSNTLVVDRPVGKAGGQGLGFNGGQLLAMAIGGCLCNDLRYVAEEMGRPIAEISVFVTLEIEGSPLLATAAKVEIECAMADGSSPAAVIERAEKVTMVSNSISRGFPVRIEGSLRESH